MHSPLGLRVHSYLWWHTTSTRTGKASYIGKGPRIAGMGTDFLCEAPDVSDSNLCHRGSLLKLLRNQSNTNYLADAGCGKEAHRHLSLLSIGSVLRGLRWSSSQPKAVKSISSATDTRMRTREGKGMLLSCPRFSDRASPDAGPICSSRSAKLPDYRRSLPRDLHFRGHATIVGGHLVQIDAVRQVRSVKPNLIGARCLVAPEQLLDHAPSCIEHTDIDVCSFA